MLTLSCNEIDTLFHISDIHIRLYQRLDEYQYVFNQFYKFLADNRGKKAIIVVTGDLLHHKNELSPECIVFTAKFLRDLASYFPVILIAGNHDALLNNTHRMDSISALLPECPDLYYLKDSGLYKYGNIVFGVSSLLDDKMTGMPEERLDGYAYVALYHGGVGQFRTNKGFEMEGLSVSTFSGYDMVLLGDIHLYQYMDKKKTIAYAGSMISQNFSETDPDHGVLVWDVATRKSHLVRMDNPHAYAELALTPPTILFRGCKYNVNNDDIPLPPKGRISVIQDEKTSAHLEAVKVLRRRFPDAQFSERMRIQCKSLTERDDVRKTTTSLSVPDILREFVSTLPASGHDEEIIQTILSSSTNDNVSSSTRSGVWELLTLEFSHMFGYGEGNVIDFTKLPPHETIGIFGDNSVGKSSLLEILSFLFYGHITRYSHGASVPREVIHFDQKKSNGSVVFRVGNEVYKIEKQMTLGKNNKVRVDEKLWVSTKDGQMVEDCSEEHRKKTDKIVAKLIGPYNHFMFTTFFLQQTESSFRNLSPKDRKEFLHHLLDLNRYEQLNSSSSDELKCAKRDLERITLELRALPDTETMEMSIQHSQEQTEKNTSEQKALDKDIISLRSVMKELIRKRRVVPDDFTTITSSLEKKIIATRREKAQLGELLKKQAHSHNELKEKYVGINVSALEEQKQGVWTELEELYKMRCPMPSPPDIPTTLPEEIRPSVSTFSQDKYTEWMDLYATQKEDLPDVDELLQAKEKLILSVKPDASSVFQDYSTDELSAFSSVNDDDDKLPAMEKNVVEWEEKNSSVWKEWDDIQTKIESWDSHEKRLAHTLSSMEFKDGCGSCSHNKSVISRVSGKCDLMTRRDTLQPIVNETKRQWTEWCKERDDLRKRVGDSKTISIILHNRGVREKMVRIDKKISKAKKRCAKLRLLEEADRCWGVVSTYHTRRVDAESKNAEVDEEIQEKKTLLEEIRVEEEIVRQYHKSLQEVDRVEKELVRIKTEMEQQEKEMEQHKKWLQYIDFNKDIDDELVEKEQKETGMVRRQRELLESHIQHTRALDEWQRQKKTRLEKGRSYDELLKKVELLQRLVHVTGRDGFPMYLLERHLPVLEKNINDIISPFMPDKKLSLRTEKKKDTMNVLLCVQKGETESVYVGGMESFIIDVGLKISFANMSELPRSNIFFIDEGISALDKKNMENLDQLFQFLEQYFPHIFIISHLREAASYVRHSIHIVKESGASQLIMNTNP